MFRSDEVHVVHLEITSKCSARCPQCARNYMGDTAPGLPQVELSLSDVEVIFPRTFLRQIKSLHICGNYGDATAAQDTVDVVRYCRESNPNLMLGIFTHGSARSVDWWQELASLRVYSNFAIDGLDDTNHIYRRGTNWKLIMRNASAFIAAGGEANWMFIAFAHNEHQVEAAKKLSEKMGFSKFCLKKTARFLNKSEQDIYDRNGIIVGTLRPPRTGEYRNEFVEEINEVFGVENFRHSNSQYVAATPIACKATMQNSIYVSAEGFVFPCCYLGKLYPQSRGESEKIHREYLDKIPGGLSAICALDRPITEIIDGPFFQEIVPAGWKAGPDRISTCARMCGSLDYVGASCRRHVI